MKRVIVSLTVMLLISCASFQNHRDQSLVERGIDAWQADNESLALQRWEKIRDPQLKEKYFVKARDFLNYYTSFRGDKLLANEIEMTLLEDEVEYILSLPEYLKNQKYLDLKIDLLTIYEKRLFFKVERWVSSQNLSSAEEYMKKIHNRFGKQSELEKTMNHVRSLVADRNNILDNASSVYQEFLRLYRDIESEKSFSRFIEKSDEGFSLLSKIENEYLYVILHYDNTEQINQRYTAIQNEKLNLQLLKDVKVRETSNSYEIVLGDIYSELPNVADFKNLTINTLENIYRDKKSEIESLLDEMLNLQNQYPNILDRRSINRHRQESQNYIEKLEQTIRHLRQNEAAIRRNGQPTFPFQIGLFNPSSTEATKSRPAVIKSSTTNSVPDWWWGQLDVDEDEIYFLVVENSDSRNLGVYTQSFKDRRITENNQARRDNMFPNNWLLEDAGFIFKDAGDYFLQVNPAQGPNQDYAAEIILYLPPPTF